MEIYRKILVFLIIVVTLYIVFRFLQKREWIKAKHLENFSIQSVFGIGPDAPEEVKSIKQSFQSIPTGIVSMNKDDANLALCQYFIKASANSAYSGSYVSTDMVNFVLSRGVRWLDFQVFPGSAGPIVGVNIDGSTTSSNQILLTDVIKTAMVNGMNTGAPNGKDPLFIQLRMENTGSKTSLYEAVGIVLRTTLGTTPYLYDPMKKGNGMVTSSTPLSRLLGKIVVVVDVGVSHDYTKAESYGDSQNQLKHFVGMESDTTMIPAYSYDMAQMRPITPLFLSSSSSKVTNVSIFSILNPGKSLTTNVDYKPMVQKYGYNVIAYQYYLTNKINTGLLANYEAVFGADDTFHTPSGYNRAFVPMAKMLSLVKST